jgi:NAD(P)-dependent dehydrogenase (short-subunit alcohol dehydrogenase family)
LTGSRRGRRALVTGASRGIGAAVAVRLAAEGADVAIVARTRDHHPTLPGSLDETAARAGRHGGRVAVVVADLADGDDRARVVPEAEAALGGPVDVLVNNAAAMMYGAVGDFPLRRRRLIFEVNVHAPFDLAQAVLPAMVARGEGWIVNVSSGSARAGVGPPTLGVYAASKAALNRLTGALADEVAATGVRVNTVEPRAAVRTEGTDARAGSSIADDQFEPMEAMVEAVIALTSCPPDRTGGVHVSLDLIDAWGLTVHDLDGRPPA